MAIKLNIEMIRTCISFVITASQFLLNILSTIEKGVTNG